MILDTHIYLFINQQHLTLASKYTYNYIYKSLNFLFNINRTQRLFDLSKLNLMQRFLYITEFLYILTVIYLTCFLNK